VFIRCAESLAIHYHEPKQSSSSLPPAERFPLLLPFLHAIDYLYRNCGIWISAVFVFLPELGPPRPLSTAAAKLLLELLSARGDEWFVRAWLAGELTVLFDVERDLRRLEVKRAEALHLSQRLAAQTERVTTLEEINAERQRAVDWLLTVVEELKQSVSSLRDENAALRQTFATRLLKLLEQLFSSALAFAQELKRRMERR
jgi:hypothetical protein